ncbi:Uncharacterised protein [Vibrio cholerae]|nr:Uncharacterised protein [Vibrio cholerae]CSI67379.1 Uncharacterised protein [Vibrio cholerae]
MLRILSSWRSERSSLMRRNVTPMSARFAWISSAVLRGLGLYAFGSTGTDMVSSRPVANPASRSKACA